MLGARMLMGHNKRLVGYTADRIPTMTSNTAPSGTASASGERAGEEAWRAFNDNEATNNVWEPPATTGWLAYEFTSPKRIEKYTVIGGNVSEVNRAPKTWTFEGWNGAGWDVLDTQTDVTATWSAGAKKLFTFTNGTYYSKYQINISANNGGTYVSVYEMEMMEGVYE